MQSRDEIVTKIARERVVEKMCVNIAKHKFDHDLQDLSQMVYEVLLTYDEERVVKMYQAKQLPFFIARVIMNQYKSDRSDFHIQIRKHSRNTLSLLDCDIDKADE